MNLIQLDYKNTRRLSENLSRYFSEVEERINSIIDKIRFAEEKLTDLQNNFNLYATRRINLKKLLGYCLDQAQYDSEKGIRLKVNMPQKYLLCETPRFIETIKYDFGLSIPKERFLPQRNKAYFNKEKADIEEQLKIQEIINEWIHHILEDLKKSRFVNLSEYFWKVYILYSDVEIAIKVCFDIINYVSTRKDFTLDIKKERQFSPDTTISIWEMTITQN